MTVHSQQLGAHASTPAAYTTIYTVPANTRTILKHIWVRNLAAAAGIAAFELILASGTTVYFYYHLAAAGASGDTSALDLWVVLKAGDVVKMAGNATGVDVILSGAELSTL